MAIGHGDVVCIAVVSDTPDHLTALEAVLADLTILAADLVVTPPPFFYSTNVPDRRAEISLDGYVSRLI
jgi:hypothetical protein